MEGKTAPLGWLWLSTTVSVPPLDSRSHHALDLQTYPVRGAFPQPDRRPHPLVRLSRLTSMARLVVRPCKLCHEVAAHLFGRS